MASALGCVRYFLFSSGIVGFPENEGFFNFKAKKKKNLPKWRFEKIQFLFSSQTLPILGSGISSSERNAFEEAEMKNVSSISGENVERNYLSPAAATLKLWLSKMHFLSGRETERPE